MVVDLVVIFEEDTPLELIQTLLPDVMVKGGDYTIEQIVGAKEVIAAGGSVIINPIVEGFSTTNLIEKIKK
jgi:D-beta-D-heptose 7-phosphate kinase/D-beta-D-heptose 1-phosphate adenosyltransferase